MLGAVWKSALIKNTAIMTRIEKIDHVRRAFLLKKLPKPQLCPHPPSGAGTCGAIDQTWGVGWGLGQHPWVRGGVGGEQSPPWCWGVQGRGDRGRRVGAAGMESQEHPSPAWAAPLGAAPQVSAGVAPLLLRVRKELGRIGVGA